MKRLFGLETAIAENLAVVHDRFTDATAATLLSALQIDLGRWRELRQRALDTTSGGPVSQTSPVQVADEEALLQKIDEQFDLLIEAAKASGFDARLNAQDVNKRTFRIVLTLVVMAVLGAALAAALLAHGIARPIMAIADTMTDIAGGREAVTIPGAGRNDEVGTLANAAEVFKQYGEKLKQEIMKNERVAEAIENITDGFMLFDEQTKLIMCNHVIHDMYPALSEIFKAGTQYEDLATAWADLNSALPEGVSAEAYIAESLRSFKESGHASRTEEDKLDDGRWIYVRDHWIDSGGLATVFTDVTPIKELQALYEKLAAQDTLTGLASRRLFVDRLDRAVALAKRLGRTVSLCYIDLDHFKPINDSLGHDAGDAVLKEVAHRLQKVSRTSDTVARLGGDEFAVLMESDSDRAGAEVFATRILNAISQPIAVGGHECNVGASIGVAILPPETADKEVLLKAADEAMYEAKRAGRGGYSIRDQVAAVSA
jgi:diguanylate cyclase (GGDEF)-like protein